MLICSSLIRSSLICSFRSNQMSDWLRSLKTNEQLWANCSGRSEEMSNREQIAQVAQDKWATMSDSLRSLRGNERMRDLLKKCWLKKSKILFISTFYIRFFYWKNEQIAHFHFFGERCEWIAHGRSFLFSDLSKLLILLIFGEQRERFTHIA